MEKENGKTITQHEQSLLKETFEVHAILEAIRETNPVGKNTAILAGMGMEKLETFWDLFEKFSRDVHDLDNQGGRP